MIGFLIAALPGKEFGRSVVLVRGFAGTPGAVVGIDIHQDLVEAVLLDLIDQFPDLADLGIPQSQSPQPVRFIGKEKVGSSVLIDEVVRMGWIAKRRPPPILQ